MIELILITLAHLFFLILAYAFGYFTGVRTGERRAVENPVDAVMKIDRENFKRELKDIKKALKIK